MSSWLGWLIVAAAVYVAVVVVRGIIQFGYWCKDTFFPEPRESTWWEEEPEGQANNGDSAVAPARGRGGKREARVGGYKRSLLVSAARLTLVHWLAVPAQWLRGLASAKRFDYWVGVALAEDDPRKKVRYLSKALALNPAYAPAWGMKADALLAMGKCPEALQCFDRVLEMNPGAVAWYEKGLCCSRLERYAEAVECFERALAACPDTRSDLYENALRQKRAAAERVLDLKS
jgi:tetratricopeptide (TPR) repeat protein